LSDDYSVEMKLKEMLQGDQCNYENSTEL